MSISDMVAGFWSLVASGFERMQGWSRLQYSAVRSLVGVVGVAFLPGCGAAVGLYSWIVGHVQGVVTEAASGGPIGGWLGNIGTIAQTVMPWLERANMALPLSEGITVAIALSTWAGSCALLKLVLALVRDVAPTGG